jgi:hypothetical protein
MRLSLILALAASSLLGAPAFADCAADIRDILARSNNAGPYRLEVTANLPMGSTHMITELVPPEAMRISARMAGETNELIIIDGNGWMLTEAGWVELPSEHAQAMAQTYLAADRHFLAHMTEAHCLGEAELEGRRVLKFTYAYRPAGATTLGTLYADPETLLPIRIEVSGDTGGTTTEIVSDYSYDPSITVAAPEP